jgi:hypothetical protein
MAAFATFAQAEARVRDKVADGTWVNGHAARATTGGGFVVRVQRKMSPSAPDNGAWIELSDDTEV